MKEQFLRYWNGLEQRERIVLTIGGIVVTLFIAYMAIMQPLLEHEQRLAAQLERKRATVAWMQSAAEQLKRHSGSSTMQNVDTGSLLTLVDTSARNSLLGNALKRVQQNGDETVRVRFEAASFDDLLVWLGSLQTQFGVQVSDITLERGDAAGRVDASITLARGT